MCIFPSFGSGWKHKAAGEQVFALMSTPPSLPVFKDDKGRQRSKEDEVKGRLLLKLSK